MSVIANFPTFSQRTNENLLYDCDFGDRIEFASRGAVITGTPTVNKNEATGTIVSVAVSGAVVQVRFASPTVDITYGIEVVIVTDKGDTIDGYFNIRGMARN